jgi:hypothetical protein
MKGSFELDKINRHGERHKNGSHLLKKMKPNGKSRLKSACLIAFGCWLPMLTASADSTPPAAIQDVLIPLAAGSVHFAGGFENPIQQSITHWNKGVVPYATFVEMFRTQKRGVFARGEMWGKAVRAGCMFYRYTHDPELKLILQKTVADLLNTRQANGSISCSEISKQPDGPGGDIWERKYVLLGLEGYYEEVAREPSVLQAMIDEADCTLAQVGPAPKVRIVDLGWSTGLLREANHVESSTILEPMLRLYKLTGYQRYLDFARYIVEVEGGGRGNLIRQALEGKDPEQIGGVYPKAYETMSLFEGVVEYYRITGDERWKKALLNYYHGIATKEITLIGNGGGDQPYHPRVMGEAWDYTALEQTNPAIRRMMETCAGVTWMKLCSQISRLTGDPSLIDEIEKYAYNGLVGAMKPTGDNFSYVNLLNGVKTNEEGWGGIFNKVHVTCCNLNGPMGLAYLPYIAVMDSQKGPVINLYNAGTVSMATPTAHAELKINTDYPLSGLVEITVTPTAAETFSISLRIPAWSLKSQLTVNGEPVQADAGTYAEIRRTWSKGDKIALSLDMRCRWIDAPHGSNRAGDNFQALIRGPVVLARDENIDADYNKPVEIVKKDGFVEVTKVPPTLPTTLLQVRVPTKTGSIMMVDYATVDNWSGKHICTWLPK